MATERCDMVRKRQQEEVEVASSSEEEEEEVTKPVLRAPFGRGGDGHVYYREVEWQGEVFKEGDTVEVLVSEVGSAKGEVGRGYGEVLFLWEGEGGNPMAEVRWFIDPRELYHKHTQQRRQLLEGEMFESDRVDDVEVESFNGHVTVLGGSDDVPPSPSPSINSPKSKSKRRRGEDEVVLRVRQHMSTIRRAFLALSSGGDGAARRARALPYSRHRDVAPEVRNKPSQPQGTTTQPNNNNPNPKHKHNDSKEKGSSGSWCGDGTEALSLSLSKLQMGASLPCREKETDVILAFLKQNLHTHHHATEDGEATKAPITHKRTHSDDAQQHTPGGERGLYVCGMPGSGKTAVVHHVIHRMRRECPELGFVFVEVNGLRLSSPCQAYSLLWHAIVHHNAAATNAAHDPSVLNPLPPAKAALKLHDYFKGGNTQHHHNKSKASHKQQGVGGSSSPVVLLLDEMDYMVQQKEVLMNLMEWGWGGVGRRGGRGMIVLGLSNTMDLPATLMPKVRSRLGYATLHFHSYTHEQVSTILRARLEASGCKGLLSGEAMGLCARKVANISGDLRTALQVVRVALRLYRKLPPEHPARLNKQVPIDLIIAADRELQAVPTLQLLQQGLTDLQLFILVCAVQQCHATGQQEANLTHVHRRVNRLLQQQHTLLLQQQHPSYTPLSPPLPSSPSLNTSRQAPTLQYGHLLEVCQRMAACGLFSLTRNRYLPSWALSIRLDKLHANDVARALKKAVDSQHKDKDKDKSQMHKTGKDIALQAIPADILAAI